MYLYLIVLGKEYSVYLNTCFPFYKMFILDPLS